MSTLNIGSTSDLENALATIDVRSADPGTTAVGNTYTFDFIGGVTPRQQRYRKTFMAAGTTR